MNTFIRNPIIYTSSLIFLSLFAKAQNNTGTENTLNAESDSSAISAKTYLGGYGNAVYSRNFDEKFSRVNLDRFVLFTGHRFNNKISFFSELEVEDAKVSGGEEGGEIALEQCYLKFNITPGNYFVAGLFLPRIGILNEDHLPNTFNGNERTQVETFIIPSTWRELGIGVYGNLYSLPVNYSFAIVNGLNSEGFEHGSVIREGRFEGRNASSGNLALTGSVQVHKNNLKVQVSGYCGGSVGLAPRQADSLNLESGFFGTPVIIAEADVEYDANGFGIRILGTLLSIPDAYSINRAYANNTPETAYGAYCEVGYNLFEPIKKLNAKQLILFFRYEKLNMNSKIPVNGIIDETLNRQHIITGVNYLPIKNVVIKADVHLLHTGNANPDLIINPDPVAPPYNPDNTFLNLGIGFSF